MFEGEKADIFTSRAEHRIVRAAHRGRGCGVGGSEGYSTDLFQHQIVKAIREVIISLSTAEQQVIKERAPQCVFLHIVEHVRITQHERASRE